MISYNKLLFNIDMLEAMIPILNDAHKKTLPGPRIEQLEKLIQIDNFKEIESYLIPNILPIILKRLYDKPNVVELALKAGTNIISKVLCGINHIF